MEKGSEYIVASGLCYRLSQWVKLGRVHITITVQGIEYISIMEQGIDNIEISETRYRVNGTVHRGHCNTFKKVLSTLQ